MTAKPQTRIMPYTPEQMFRLVADVKKYPEFLPWCAGAFIHKETPQEMLADLTIGYGLLRESFTSHVYLTPYESIQVDCVKGPFNKLTNLWKFKPAEDNQTEVEFLIDFQLSNPVLQFAMDKVYNKAFSNITEAFHKRAQQIYGT